MSSEEMDATSVEIPSRRRMTSCLVCFEQNQVSDAVNLDSAQSPSPLYASRIAHVCARTLLDTPLHCRWPLLSLCLHVPSFIMSYDFVSSPG